MFNTVFSEERRAQAGIGTLIVFVAMVLVAAITAGVLVSTAGVLQSQAQATGQESTAQVSNTLDIYTAVGTVDGDSIDSIDMTVSLGPGSNPIDLENSVIDYVGPGGHSYVGDVQAEVDGSDGTVLESDSDRGTITFDVGTETAPLEAGDRASLRIITDDGAQITQPLTVPTVIEDGETVKL